MRLYFFKTNAFFSDYYHIPISIIMLKEDHNTHRDQDDDDVSKEGNTKPNAYRVEDDNNLEEKDLKTHYLFGDAKMKNPSQE